MEQSIYGASRHGAAPSAPFTYRPPSPPHVHVGPYHHKGLRVELLDAGKFAREGVSEIEFRDIFKIQYVVQDNMPQWSYERRRQAQMITPAIYLGPTRAARDREFIRREGITMLLAIRDNRSAAASMVSGDKVAQEIGIESAAIDVEGSQELIAQLPRAIRVINNHLIAVYRDQLPSRTSEHHLNSPVLDAARPGKILVFCESGNDRSVIVVAAYLMVMYGLDLVHAVQFIQSQRFCIALDDGLKSLLQAFQDIIKAREDVGQSLELTTPETAVASPNQEVSKNNKRGIEDVEDVGMDQGGDELLAEEESMDRSRFEGRAAFAPYVDR